MTQFLYQARDAVGNLDKGTIEADSPRQARLQLRARGLVPVLLQVERGGKARRWMVSGWRKRRLGAGERVQVTRQLAVLLGGGVSLDEALSGVAAEAEKEAVRRALTEVRLEVLSGCSLAQALERFPEDFPALYPALVGAGERSGRLAWVMERLAEYASHQDHLRGKVLGALAYPLVLMAVATLIVGFLMGSVVPQVVSVFSSNHQTLPWITRALIGLSDGLRDWGWLLLLVLLMGGGWAGFLLRQPLIRLAWDRHLLGWPLVGRLVLGYDTERLSSTLAILVGSGVPLLMALQGAARAVHNHALRRSTLEALERVREGSGLARALEVNGVFPRILIQLIQAGEKTGRLDALLEQAALHEARQLERRLMLMMTLLEPAMILLMGIVVGTIVLAILMPIMDLNQIVQ
jgi:general secretion pathway protein F